MFVPNSQYSKWDIYDVLNVPKNQQRGAWDTGYREYEGNIYIFSNIGIPGRTGHDYNNYWDGDLFKWEAKTKSNINQPLIRKMLEGSNNQSIFLFTRTDDRLPFTFEGKIKVLEFVNSSPVKITWGFVENPYIYSESDDNVVAEEGTAYYEGRYKRTPINKYERNPLARRMCIEHHGCVCHACGFDFYHTYGELGRGFIHVHHIVPISTIRKNYILYPEKDLIPVCPNCHAMLHKQSPALNVAALKEIIRNGALGKP